MDGMNHNGKPKRTRVLRATDVIPPFDKSVPPSDKGRTNGEPPRAGPFEADGREGGPEGCFVPGDAAGPLPADGVEIPTYDLAENILAEQRRAAGKRRRAPGRTEDEPVASIQGAGVRVSVPELASPDLLELQRIVGEIVARDIERLCRRPDSRPYVRP